jgi:hypothetical protein
MIILTLALASLLTAPQAVQDTPQPPEITRDWQTDVPYVAPDFDGYFPDDVEAGVLLDALSENGQLDALGDADYLTTVRAGFRRMKGYRTRVLAGLGNRFIWNKDPQNPDAIELMYHAADFSEAADVYGCRHEAVYFGLSVTKPKTPAILRTLAELCVAVDSRSDLGRVAWGAADQKDELLPYLAPFLASEDEAVKAKARAVVSIIEGDLTAREWAIERAKFPPPPRPWKEMPDVRATLRTGNSAARAELLEKIRTTHLARDMDDSFIADFAAAFADPDPIVRRDIVRAVSQRFLWVKGPYRLPDAAIDLVMRASHDPEDAVRYDAVYYGISNYLGPREDVLERMLEMASNPADAQSRRRLTWGLGRSGEATKARLLADVEGADKKRAQAAYDLYREVFGERPPVLPAEIPKPSDLVGTWLVTVAGSGRRNLHVPPLTITEDSAGKLHLEGEELDELGHEILMDFAWTDSDGVLYFSFNTPVEGAKLRSTGNLKDGSIEGTSRLDGLDTLIVWTAVPAES